MELEVLSQAPAGMSRPTPILLVHGAWHGAWCWQEHMLPYCAEHGYQTYALSLRGHGASESPRHLRTTRIRDYAADVAQVAAGLETPPILVGHSMGGLVVQKYLESHAAPAAILLAPVPPSGALRATLNVARKHPLRFARVNLTWSLYPIIGTPRMAREYLFTRDLPPDRVNAYFSRLQDESYLAYLDMVAFALPRPRRVSTPMLVIAGGRDAIFTPREARRTARAYHADVKLFPDAPHDMILDAAWQPVADAMLTWLDSRGL